MTTAIAEQTAADAQERHLMHQLCDEALDAIHRAMDSDPKELTEDVEVAERKTAALRDHLIEQLRKEKTARKKRQLREALDQANMALSMILSVEYPIKGIQHEHLVEAARVLRAMRRRAPLRGA